MTSGKSSSEERGITITTGPLIVTNCVTHYTEKQARLPPLSKWTHMYYSINKRERYSYCRPMNDEFLIQCGMFSKGGA